MRTTRQKDKPTGSDGSLAYAVALQDHFSRMLQLPGGPQKLPSLSPGAAPTLAQRLGLLPQPDKLLTSEEWDKVHGMARQRQESLTACAICLESFKTEQQVLLSCSHVFHAQCLKSFESHVRMKACPLCRKAWYQKMFIHDSAEAFKHVCATRIQAAVRGWICRKHLALHLLRHQPPTATRLKRQWAAGRLGEAGQALSGLVKSAENELEGLFAELDATLAASRGLADPVGASLQATGAEAGPSGVLTEDSSQGIRQAVTASGPDSETIKQQGCRLSGNSASAHQRASGRTGSEHRTVGTGSSHLQQQRIQQSTGHLSQQQTLRRNASSTHTSSSGSSDQQAPANVTRHRNLNRTSSSSGTSRQRGHASSQLSQRNAFSRVPPAVVAGAAALTRAQQLQHGPVAASAATADVAPAGALAAPAADVEVVPAVDWEEVVGKACQRGETECAICLGPLTGTQRETQGVALLSCSHVFHVQCVLSFERFEQARGGRKSCPVCRAVYSKQCFAVPEVP